MFWPNKSTQGWYGLFIQHEFSSQSCGPWIIQISVVDEKQCQSWLVGFRKSQLIWFCTVFQRRYRILKKISIQCSYKDKFFSLIALYTYLFFVVFCDFSFTLSAFIMRTYFCSVLWNQGVDQHRRRGNCKQQEGKTDFLLWMGDQGRVVRFVFVIYMYICIRHNSNLTDLWVVLDTIPTWQISGLTLFNLLDLKKIYFVWSIHVF